MTLLKNLTLGLFGRLNRLIRNAEAAHPEMPEAAMVYVGDVYALRVCADAHTRCRSEAGRH